MSDLKETEPLSGRAETPDPPPSNGISPLTKAYAVLLVHGAACVALALSIALGLDGYEAGDDSNPRRVEGKLLLRVSDITTLISFALVIIKLTLGSWSTMILWASGRYMLYRARTPESPSRVSTMLRWKLPPWPLGTRVTMGVAGWAISCATSACFIQALTSPLLTGSVSWNTGFRVSSTAVAVSAVDPAAWFEGWFWYNKQGAWDIKYHLRGAAGFASSAWADPSTMSAEGTSLSGNGCRHIVNNDGLPANSVLLDATLPCIAIHGLHWYLSTEEIEDEDWADAVHNNGISVVNDNPFRYSQTGTSLVYDVSDLRPDMSLVSNSDMAKMPTPDIFSGTRTVALLAWRGNKTEPPCNELAATKFGNLDASPYHIQNSTDGAYENCYLIGKLNFTAGVTRSSRAKYLTPRVVEDQTPIEDVKFEPNPWVREALWLLPDLMTMLSLMNTSRIGTFNNVDNYIKGLTRQAYLGAWDALSHGFDDRGPNYSALPSQTRIIADVSDRRVFSWLALCGLVSATGVFLLTVVLTNEDLALPEDRKGERNGKEQWASESVAAACI